LLSTRCGNFPELVVPEVNGWVFDPSNSDEVRAAFANLASRSMQELRTMGAHSENRARRLFSTQSVVQGFLDDMYCLRR